MSFENTSQAVSRREKYDIYDQNDRKEIAYFEEMLKPYLERSITLFNKVLTGFELYLHENGMFVYSPKYPEGAVRMDRLEDYHIADMKYRALTHLWDKQQEAKRKEAERIQTLI